MQLRVLSADQLHDRKTNRVGTAGRSSGKDSVGSIVDGRFADQIEVAGPVKLPEDEEVGESLNVDEPRLEFGQELEDTLGFMFRVQALGNVAEFGCRGCSRIQSAGAQT